MHYAGLRIHDGDSAQSKRWKTKTLDDLLRLRAALSASNDPDQASRAPGLDQRRLRIATWNLREFDTGRYAYRLNEAYYYLAEVISAFDLVALQEVKGDLRPFRKLMKVLGGEWDYIMTDADESSAAHNERMVFVYNASRVKFQGTAGELNLSGQDRLLLPDSFDVNIPSGVRIELPDGAELSQPDKIPHVKDEDNYRIKPAAVVDLPPGTKITLPEGAQLAFKGQPDEFGFDVVNGRIRDKTLDLKSGDVRMYSEDVRLRLPSSHVELGSQQFARTPFMVYFQAEWMKLALCTVHIYFGDNADGSPQMARRRAEIAALTKTLARKAREGKDSDANSYFVALGDFNIKSPEHETMQALRDNAFEVPEAIREIPAGTNVARDKYYDQIAFWMGENERNGPREYTKISVVDAGVFDFFKHVYREGADDPGGVDEQHFRKRMEEVGRTYSDYRAWRTHQMSDHLPMWVEIETDFADAYLQSLVKDQEG